MKALFSTRTLLGYVLAASLAMLGACSKNDAPSPSSSTPQAAKVLPAQAYERVAAQGKGFTVGALMSAQTVYVLFDPQCPHCGHLWNASLPLHKRVKFVWVPVAILGGGGKSLQQGAALLSAANPMELMTQHETSLLAKQGGITVQAPTPELEAAMKANNELFNSLGAESVPYVVAKNPQTGATQVRAGAMDTAALAQFLGLGAQ
jgi:thiol:disulfide interchange protein DsbG